MALKQKLLSISLAASTLLGVGLSAEEKEPQKQSIAAAQTIPAAGEALTSEQQTMMLKKLAEAKRAYRSAVQKAQRATARGTLSATDKVVLQANIDQARENVELYEKTIDETVKQQAVDIQKRYDEELKEINQMIRDVEKGKMPKIQRPEPKEKMSLDKHRVRRAVEKER